MKTTVYTVALSASEKERWLESFRYFGDPETVFFMDIETTGFSRAYDSVYLVGYLYYKDGQFFIEQHLASDQRDEPEVIEAYCDRLAEAETIVTFNGDMFDLPFMESRHHLLHCSGRLPSGTSADLYRRYRPLTRIFGWENCKLKTIERFLEIDREDVFDGGQLIAVYEEYALSQDESLEKVLLLHNYEDILNLPRLLRIERYLHCLREAEVEEIRLEKEWGSNLSLRVILAQNACISAQGDADYGKDPGETLHFRTEAGSPVLFLTLPVYEGILYHYLPNPEDYYYLPESDSIIHASLVDTVGNAKKKRATAKNCRIVRQGQFLPAWEAPPGLHSFQKEKKKAFVFCEKEEFLNALQKEGPTWKTEAFHHLLHL